MHHPIHPQASDAVRELHDQVLAFLQEKTPDALTSSEINFDFPVFNVRKERILEVLSALKSAQEMGYTFLTTMCGIHYPEQQGAEFALMYQLHNMPKNRRIRLKVFMSSKDLEIPTVTHLWPTANWMEREAFDFYGFRFKGHPDLRRILNMEEMNYHPMRKEYPLEDAGRDDKADRYFGR
jgi:NADH-quinone oxidoreductase subunit C